MAGQFAMGKERFWYLSVFVGTLGLILPIAALKKHNPLLLAPLFPLSLLWSFQYDMFYGNMQLRAQKEAARLIKEEPERFFLPKGSLICEQSDYNEIVGLPTDY